MIMVTGFTGVFLGPVAILPGVVLLGMFAYRVNPELMRNTAAGKRVRGLLSAPAPEQDASPPPSSTRPATKVTTGQTQSTTRGTTVASQSSTTAREVGWSGNKIYEKVRGKRKTILSIVKQLREGVSLNAIRLDGLPPEPSSGDDDGELDGLFGEYLRNK